MTNRCYLHWICWRVVCPAVWGRRLKRTTCTSSAAVCKHSDRSSVNSSSLNELSKKNLHWLRKRNTATQLISGISFKRIIKQSKKIVYRNPLKDSEEGAVCSSNVSLVSYPCERYKFVIPTMNASNTCILVNIYTGSFRFWVSLSLRLSLSPKFGLRPKISQKVKSFFVWTQPFTERLAE